MNMKCSYFSHHQCRSCDYIDFSYEESLRLKLGEFKNLFHLWHEKISPIIPSAVQAGSRNKVKLTVGGSSMSPALGIVKDQKNFQIQDLVHCPLHDTRLNHLIESVKELIVPFKITPYHIKERKGELKGVIAHLNKEGSECFLRFVCRSRKDEKKIRSMIPILKERIPYLKVVTLNIQPIPHAILEGPEEIILTDEDHIIHHFSELKLFLRPSNFFQTNTYVAEKLYQSIATYFKELNNKEKTLRNLTVIDLYCGVGGISFHLAASSIFNQIIAVELSAASIGSALQAQELNQHKLLGNNLTFIAQDVELFLKNYHHSLTDRPSRLSIIVNPPRSGLRSEVIKSIQSIRPHHFVYSSCNPMTLQRDLLLLDQDYTIEKILPFDMFPYTKHLEVVVFCRLRE